MFTIISSEFMKLSDKREVLSQQIMLELNNAFDFAEKAFGHGPEMVLFVTELAAGFTVYHLYRRMVVINFIITIRIC